jgi:hypothetical protein
MYDTAELSTGWVRSRFFRNFGLFRRVGSGRVGSGRVKGLVGRVRSGLEKWTRGQLRYGDCQDESTTYLSKFLVASCRRYDIV